VMKGPVASRAFCLRETDSAAQRDVRSGGFRIAMRSQPSSFFFRRCGVSKMAVENRHPVFHVNHFVP
jgi:hypothetical protein